MAGLLRRLYLCYLSQPRGDRALYRAAGKGPIRKITQLGVGTAERTLRLLELCAASAETVFTGIDLFEMRRGGGGLALKEAHRKLAATKIKIRLLPGDPHAALSRGANNLGEQDLIVIAADQDATSTAKAWHYVPRLMHARTVVLVEKSVDGGTTWHTISHAEAAKLAAAAKDRRAA